MPTKSEIFNEYLKGSDYPDSSREGGRLTRTGNTPGEALLRSKGFREATWKRLSPKQRREFFFDADGNVDPEGIKTATEAYKNELIANGYPPGSVDKAVREYQIQLTKDAAKWINSPEAQTDIALEGYRDEAQSLKDKAATPEELFKFYEDYLGDENRYKALGDYNAFADQALLQGESKGLMDQGKALERLASGEAFYNESIGTEGNTAADRAAMEQARKQASRGIAAQNNEILRDMAARGMAGGGSEIVAKMMGQQGLQSAMADQIAQNQIAARQRAMDSAAQRDVLRNYAQQGLGGLAAGYGSAAQNSYARDQGNVQRRQAADEFNANNMMKRDSTMAQAGAQTNMDAYNQAIAGNNAMNAYYDAQMASKGTREAMAFQRERDAAARKQGYINTAIDTGKDIGGSFM